MPSPPERLRSAAKAPARPPADQGVSRPPTPARPARSPPASREGLARLPRCFVPHPGSAGPGRPPRPRAPGGVGAAPLTFSARPRRAPPPPQGRTLRGAFPAPQPLWAPAPRPRACAPPYRGPIAAPRHLLVLSPTQAPSALAHGAQGGGGALSTQAGGGGTREAPPRAPRVKPIESSAERWGRSC